VSPKQKYSGSRKRSAGWDRVFNRANYLIFGASLVLLVIGYIFLSIGTADSATSRTIAPVILVLCYCVLLPMAILYRGKKESR
jgi:hypothetical protein